MATISRQSSFTGTVDHLSQLGDPLRLRMLRMLEREELSVGELVSVMQVPQSSGSRHLKVLYEGGWLVRRSAGTTAYYRLVSDELEPAMRGLWLAVRGSIGEIPEATGDDQRLASVIAKRVSDSGTFFGRHAGRWDALRDDMFGQRFTDQALLGLLDESWRVADLGCGTGNCTELLCPWVSRISAIDRSPEMLDGAKQRLGQIGGPVDHVDFIEAELTDLPIKDRTIDAAACMLVLHHVPDPEAVLSEMRRILTTERGGGVALIVDMCDHARVEYRRSMGHEHLGFSPGQIELLCSNAGFERTRVVPLTPDVEAEGPPLFVATASVRPREIKD